MRVRIPTMTEADAETIADQLEQLARRSRIRRVRLEEPAAYTNRKTTRRRRAA